MGSQRPKKTFRTPENCRVYAVGDIHGRLDLLQRLHEKILEDAAQNPPKLPGKRHVLVYVGDYVDRGPDSVGVIELLLNNPLAGFETHYLKGNHEDFMLHFLDNGADGNVWLMNGGIETLQSYGISLPWDLGGNSQGPPPLGPGEMESLRLALKAAVPESHLDFLTRLERHHTEGDYLFVHAGIRPGVPLEKQSERDLIWIREGFLDYEGDFGVMVVHGHSARSKPDIRDNRIGIDTKSGYSGRLTALVLDGDNRRFLQA